MLVVEAEDGEVTNASEQSWQERTNQTGFSGDGYMQAPVAVIGLQTAPQLFTITDEGKHIKFKGKRPFATQPSPSPTDPLQHGRSPSL